MERGDFAAGVLQGGSFLFPQFQIAHKIANLVYKVSGGSFTKGMVGYVLVTALVAQVVPSAGDLIGSTSAGWLGENPNGYLAGFVFFLVSFVLNQVMVHHSVMQSIPPIAIMTCVALGYNLVGPLILAITGSLTAFMSPMATLCVPLMMPVGGYTQKDLFKMVWLPAIIACVTAVFWTVAIFPV